MRSSRDIKGVPRRIEKLRTIIVYDFEKIESHLKWIHKHRVSKHDFKIFPVKIVCFNFSRTRFLKPYHVVPLACLIHEYHREGFRVKMINIPNSIEEYLKSFQFDQFCNNDHLNDFPAPSDPKTFPLWRIEQNGISLYPKFVQQYFERNHFDGKSLFSLSISLAELMNNIFDHSESTIPGYTFTQYNTRTNSIITCVCDFGIGIPDKVNQYLRNNQLEKLSSIDALHKAFIRSFSTSSLPHNRGFGWDNIFSNIKDLKSKLLIISNNAFFCLLPDGKVLSVDLTVRFPGTLVVIWLDARCLPICEEELTDELQIL